MKRLYQQIYLTIIASLIMVVLVLGILWQFGARDRFDRDIFEAAENLAALSLPAADAPDLEQQRAIRRLSEALGVDMRLFSAELKPIAGWGEVLAAPDADRLQSGRAGGFGPRAWNIRLADGRWLVVDAERDGPPRRHPLFGMAIFLGGIALAVALGAYPFVRRLTRRLERLQLGVERIGTGDFTTRVKPEGRDEVAHLASSFNEAAEKIEQLMAAHRQLLANTSHELRTPLARIRLGLDLLKGDLDEERRTSMRQDITELDELIDELLLMSRLDAKQTTTRKDDVDLLAIVAEECARQEDCHLQGEPVELNGDVRLLRRMVRNLLQNAALHGKPPVEISLSQHADRIVLDVVDQGDGIAAQDRQKIFEPFFRGADRQGIKGYGLGLPIARQIALSHGGDAIATTTVKGATCMRVTLRA